MKKLVFAFSISMIAALLIAGMAFAEPGVKVEVCHFDKDAGTYTLININDNAWDAHIAHGDHAPGEPVPGVSGMKFGADCTPVIDPTRNVTGNWTGHSGMKGNLAYSFTMVLTQAADGSVTGTISYPGYPVRTITGNVSGSTLTFTQTQASNGYWATVSGTFTATYFYGEGTHSGSGVVALEAWR